MKVLLFSWEYPPVIEGGLGRHLRKLSEGLAQSGIEVHVLTRGGGRLPTTEQRRGVFVHRVTEPPFPTEMNAFLDWVEGMNQDMAARASELVRSYQFDLVHSHDWVVAKAAETTARTCGLPWLVTVHATEYGRHQGWVHKHPQSHIHAIERGMAKRADHVITCSDYMARHVAKTFRVRASKITTIPNGIDLSDLQPAAGVDLQQLRLTYADADQRLILMVGRLVFEKGFHLALDAIAPIAKRERNIRFVIAGTGTAEAELKAQAAKLGLARYGTFIGWTGDDLLHSLYRVADLCIVPSIYEPFGLVALEAMASGCLCVVADTGGLREVVPPGSKVGLRFPVSDSGALGTTVEQILTDEQTRKRLVTQAREHVLKFDWAEVAMRTQAIYTELALTAAPARNP